MLNRFCGNDPLEILANRRWSGGMRKTPSRMSNRWTAMLLGAWLCACPPVAYSADKQPSGRQVEMRWTELGPFLARGQVSTVLPDGTVLQGRAISVDSDALVLDVSKSSDKRAYPKGRTSISRGQITTLSIRRTEGKLWRAVLTSAGIFVTMVLAGYVLSGMEANSGDQWVGGVALLAIAGGGVGGYYGGKSIDSKSTVIKLLPD